MLCSQISRQINFFRRYKMSRRGENIYKRKDGRWEGRYKKGFSPDGRTLYGYCYGKTYREVKEKLSVFNSPTAANQGNHTKGQKRFCEFCDEWLSACRNRVKLSTFITYTTAVEKHIKPYFGGHPPADITSDMVDSFTELLLNEKKLSPKTVKDYLVVLKSIFKFTSRTLGSVGLIEVTMPKQTREEMRVLSVEEQNKLFRFLLTEPDPCKFGTLVALLTGLSIGEVCALRCSDISLTEKTIKVRETMQRVKNLDGDGAKTKIIFSKPKTNNSARVVPLTNTAYELCKKHMNLSDPQAFLLTGSSSKYIEPRILQFKIKQYGAACGIENIHFHTLRHTFATRCVEVGFEIKSLSEVLGHATPKITLERYVHSSIEFKRQNMIKLEAIGF